MNCTNVPDDKWPAQPGASQTHPDGDLAFDDCALQDGTSSLDREDMVYVEFGTHGVSSPNDERERREPAAVELRMRSELKGWLPSAPRFGSAT